MKFITGKNRAQIPLFVSSLEEAIDQDNEIRLIDLFCFRFLPIFENLMEVLRRTSVRNQV